MAESLSSILASERRLINEASEALPHQFNTCTFSMGYIRQAVYLCLTCALPRGICAACSIACHTDHEQVELFPKRHFRCDCPTDALAHPCTLHKTPEGENVENVYGQNFRCVFCRCGRPYDAKKERETMIQCLSCEDWFHESCLNLRERPPSREPTPEAGPPSFEVRHDELSAEADDNADAASLASSSGLPPPLINDSAYDSFVCRDCVLVNPTLRRWAGTNGAMMVTRDSADAPWAILNGVSEDEEAEVDLDENVVRNPELRRSVTQPASGAGNKRMLDIGWSEELRMKRPRTDSEGVADEPPITKPTCLAPRIPGKAQEVLHAVSSEPQDFELGAGDIFFTDGWRMRWCHCDECLPPLKIQPYFLEEEETYEPPEDPDSAFSLEELGMRALQSLPRDRALDGIRAFNEMRDDLLLYLRPFAREGKVVNEADVRRFFEEKQEKMHSNREKL